MRSLPKTKIMSNNSKKTIPELLAPAGDMDSLRSAICAGANAVYFGTDLFNARIRARNFNLDEAREAIKLCHAHGVKAFVTLNIAIYEKEIPKMLEYVSSLYESGVDALIVSDIGAMRLIKKYFPDLELHASTQSCAHNLDGVKFLESMGCARTVVARELDKESIRHICDGADGEIEIFVHGAHCMSVSGGCLMSYAMGGRSGNRGECAQPCRLPYKIENKSGYPLSLKDMSLASHITEIIDTGATSLKIEGRMKSADYVGGVVSVWRELLDKRKNADNGEIARLESIFSRQGFTDGYFENRIDERMLGVRSEEDKRNTKEQITQDKALKKPDLDISARLVLGEMASITVKSGGKTATAYADIVEEALSAPMSESDIEKSLARLGATPYQAGNITIEKSDNIIVRVSALNALRREAVDKLIVGERRAKIIDYVPEKHVCMSKKIRSALFASCEQIPENASYFDRIYVYADRYKGGCGANGIYLPPVILDREWDEIEKIMKNARRDGIKYALVSNIGQVERAMAHGFEITADFRFNIFNPQGAKELCERGFEDVILSPELSLPQCRALSGFTLVVYGKLPVMTTHKCVLKSSVGCDKCKAYITDRMGARMYCEGIFGHRNIIYNSVPIYMADRQDMLSDFSWHFIFSDETRRECYEIIEAYKHSKPTNKSIRRIKS